MNVNYGHILVLSPNNTQQTTMSFANAWYIFSTHDKGRQACSVYSNGAKLLQNREKCAKQPRVRHLLQVVIANEYKKIEQQTLFCY